ncbi:MAG TPA: hypothetical protein VKU00_24150 [Chthonomonadaceae bacterium]|nr:hypothetical protein [Chthonomonadaceae bacterium]
MSVRKGGLLGLALLIGLGTLVPLLSGCKQEEKNNDSTYYTGSDFKGHGSEPAATDVAAKKRNE